MSESMPERKTNYTMKVFFCFAITFITAGHVIIKGHTGGVSFLYNFFPVQGYHVAMFLFASGYFYNCRHEGAPLAFVKKKFCRLIIPLYLLTFAYAGICLAMRALGFTFVGQVTAYNLLIDPVLGAHGLWLDMPLWFVAPFFLAQMVDFVLRLLIKCGTSRSKEAALIVLYLAIGVVTTSLVISVYGRMGFSEGTSNIWVLLARTGFFMPCFAFGRIYKVFLERHDNLPNWLYFGICFALQLLAYLVCEGHLTYLVSWCGYATGRFVPFYTTAVGIAFWLRVSRLLAPGLEKSKSMLLVANNTYSIMAHQFLGFFLVKCLFAACAMAGLIGNFDMAAFCSDIWYYWVPERVAGSATVFGVVYIAAGMGVPIAIHLVWSKIYGYARNALRRNKE